MFYLLICKIDHLCRIESHNVFRKGATKFKVNFVTKAVGNRVLNVLDEINKSKITNVLLKF